MRHLTGKAIIVTGAGQGIGAVTAEYLAGQGAAVVIADIDADHAAAVADSIGAAGGQAAAWTCDVSSWEECETLMTRTLERFGHIDGLVNNAGILHRGGPLDEVDGAAARRVFEVNLIGSYNAGVAAMKRMSPGGAIVNVTSGVHTGLADGASYGASKGGVASLTYAWAIDGKKLGIRVNAISPVATTSMTLTTEALLIARGELDGPRPYVAPESNCPAIGYLLSEQSENLTGQILRVHGNTLQLMAHPAVMHPEVTKETWTIDDVDEAVSTVFSEHLPPLGMAAMEVSYVPLSKVMIVPGGSGTKKPLF